MILKVILLVVNVDFGYGTTKIFVECCMNLIIMMMIIRFPSIWDLSRVIRKGTFLSLKDYTNRHAIANRVQEICTNIRILHTLHNVYIYYQKAFMIHRLVSPSLIHYSNHWLFLLCSQDWFILISIYVLIQSWNWSWIVSQMVINYYLQSLLIGLINRYEMIRVYSINIDFCNGS